MKTSSVCWACTGHLAFHGEDWGTEISLLVLLSTLDLLIHLTLTQAQGMKQIFLLSSSLLRLENWGTEGKSCWFTQLVSPRPGSCIQIVWLQRPRSFVWFFTSQKQEPNWRDRDKGYGAHPYVCTPVRLGAVLWASAMPLGQGLWSNILRQSC